MSNKLVDWLNEMVDAGRSDSYIINMIIGGTVAFVIFAVAVGIYFDNPLITFGIVSLSMLYISASDPDFWDKWKGD